MSRGNLYVLFPDGEVRYGIYNGTADVVYPPLQPTPEFTWDEWRGVGPWRDPFAGIMDAEASEPVLIATDYGGGSWWPGRATRDYVTEGRDPYDDVLYDDVVRGEPIWATYPPPIPMQSTVFELEGR